MTEAARQFHRLKFRLWYFSRLYPTVGQPLRWAAQVATAGFTRGYQQRLEQMGESLFPPDRYERQANVACQFVMLTDDATRDQLRGMVLLLNHFRIPYHRCEARNLAQWTHAAPRTTAVAMTVGPAAPMAQHIADVAGNVRVKVVSVGNAADLLPHRAGLRSSITRAFVRELLISEFPVVTGFLPPQAGVRIDDVAGRTCRQYVPEMISRGWTPNLGIFLEDFPAQDPANASFLSSLDRDRRIECSPHAQTAYEFLFYNYKDGEPFADEQFAAMWQEAVNRFDRWGLSVCPVLNAHFHAFSPSTYARLSRAGVKYIFSELSPDGTGVEPGPQYLPSGDPLCTTGQIDNAGMYQIHSGDPTVCCNLPDSTYDFLMHNTAGDVAVRAGRKFAERVALSVETGFAAFATTHEYLLDELTRDQVAGILEQADKGIASSPCVPGRVSMSEIGRACENHTNVSLESVDTAAPGFRVAMTGPSTGDTAVCVFGRGELAVHAVPAFQDRTSVEVQAWD